MLGLVAQCILNVIPDASVCTTVTAIARRQTAVHMADYEKHAPPARHTIHLMRAHTHQTVILAAGLGSRLGSAEAGVPKPLMEVGGAPLIAQALAHAEASGCREAVVVIGYEGARVRAAVEALAHAADDPVRRDAGSDRAQWSLAARGRTARGGPVFPADGRSRLRSGGAAVARRRTGAASSKPGACWSIARLTGSIWAMPPKSGWMAIGSPPSERASSRGTPSTPAASS